MLIGGGPISSVPVSGTPGGVTVVLPPINVLLYFPTNPQPDFGYEVGYEPRVISPADKGGAYIPRALDGVNTLLRTTALTYTNITTADKEILRRFFDTYDDVPFLWAPYLGTNYTYWRMANYEQEAVAKGFWTVTIRLEEQMI